jgi:hypothetical protein
MSDIIPGVPNGVIIITLSCLCPQNRNHRFYLQPYRDQRSSAKLNKTGLQQSSKPKTRCVDQACLGLDLVGSGSVRAASQPTNAQF